VGVQDGGIDAFAKDMVTDGKEEVTAGCDC